MAGGINSLHWVIGRRWLGAEFVGQWAAIEDIDATRCRVRMTAGSLDWPVMALGAVGAGFQVISPPELLDRVHDWGRRFSQASGTTHDD